MDNSNEVTSTITTASLSITILSELENLLPELSPEEKSALRLSVENEGVRDSLLVWRTVNDQGEEVRVLIDGHNRYRITESLGRDVEELPVKDIDFADMDDAKAWIIANQLMRRNLTDAQRSHFRGMVYESVKKSQGGDRGNQYTKLAKGQSEPLADGELANGKCYHLADDSDKSTAEKLAEQFNVSPSTIKRDAAFAKRVESLPPEEKAAVLRGDKKLPKAARAKPSTHAKETVTEVTQMLSKAAETASEANGFTPDTIRHIHLEAPHRVVYLLFRAIDKASEYVGSLESITSKEYSSLVEGVQRLQTDFDRLLEKIEGLTVIDPVESCEDTAAVDSVWDDLDSDSDSIDADPNENEPQQIEQHSGCNTDDSF